MQKNILTAILMLAACATHIGAETFSHESINFETTDNGECQVIYSPDASGHIVLPSSVTPPDDPDAPTLTVTAIADKAFNGCTQLLSVQIPTTVVSIGAEAFRGCNSLVVAEIAQGVRTVGNMAFRGCTALTDIQLRAVPQTCGSYMFAGCASLTEAELPQGWTAVPDGMFADCHSLQSVILPASLQSIGNEAFATCSALTHATVPDQVSRIGRKAFFNCQALKALYIGNSVATISTQAFDKCAALSEVICRSQTPPATEMYPFDESIFNTCLLVVPVGRQAAYRAEYPWNAFMELSENDYPGIYARLTIATPAASVSYDENYGSCPIVQLVADDGWEIYSATLDDNDITDKINQAGILQLPPLYDDCTLRVVFKDTNSGLNSIMDGNPRLRVEGLTVTLTGVTTETPMRVYNTVGQCIYAGTEHSFTAPSHGIYVINIQNQNFKLSI